MSGSHEGVPVLLLQHNLTALQTQVTLLQHENSTLTRRVCLKDNYIELKDQQFRVMQRRLADLEVAVAEWKDRYLQQVHAHEATTSRRTGREHQEDEEAPWTRWTGDVDGASRAHRLAHVQAQLELLAHWERTQVEPLVTAMVQRPPGECQRGPMADVVLVDVSDHLSRLLVRHVLPAVLAAADKAQQLQVFCRTSWKQTTDFKVATRQPPGAPGTAADRAAQGASAIERTRDIVARNAQSTAETDETGTVPHLFDYVELDRRGAAARPPAAHGPRELHATKAMFISRPLSGAAAVRAAMPGLDQVAEKALDKAARRYTLTPKRTGPTFAVETTRTYTSSLGAQPSPAQSPSSLGMFRLGSAGELISTPLREKEGKDGKIKKMVGSVFERLSRHKSQQSLTTSSLSSHASPLPLGMLVGSIEVEDETLCDGCGRGPLLGMKWVCRTCRLRDGEEYELCEKCYGQGIHGEENEEALFARVETIVVRKCPRLASETELLRLLRVGICKANLKKFSFCLTWIADLLQCNRTTNLRARALEIAHVPPAVRSEFVRLLRELLTRYRPDIDLKTEWEPVAGAQHGAFSPGTPAMRCESAPDELDTLRIWVKDAPLAATASTGATSIGPPSVC